MIFSSCIKTVDVISAAMIRTINNVTHTRALKEKLDDSLGNDIYFAMNEAKQLSFYDNAISEIAVKYDIPYMELS